MKLEFGDFRLGFGNIYDLMTPILADVLRREDRSTVIAGVGKDGDDSIDLCNGNQGPGGPFVAGVWRPVHRMKEASRNWKSPA
jgi:hypothetical protein